MKKINGFNLLYNMIMIMFIAGVGVQFFGPSALILCALVFMYSLLPVKLQPNGVLRSEVLRVLFSNDIQENLYPDNEFYKDSLVDADIDVSVESVDIPQAGTPPAVIKNPTQLPVQSRVREDDKKSYKVDLYVTEVDIVTDARAAVSSADIRDSIVKNQQYQLRTRVASELAIIWTPSLSSNIIRTSGTNNVGSKAAGMTGQRKELTYNDIIDAVTILDNMGIPDDGLRRMLIPSLMFGEIKKIPELRDFDKTGIVGQSANGAIGRIQNCNVFKRTETPMFNSTAQKKAFGAAVAATDNLSILIWHPSFVRRAEGKVEVYYASKVPGYQGDIMNSSVRSGGCISRNDEKGVVAIVQA